MEFDTSHFRLQDLKGSPAGRAGVPKRITPKGAEAPIELDIPQAPDRPGKAVPRSTLKQASTAATKPAVAGAGQTPAPPVAAKPAALISHAPSASAQSPIDALDQPV